METPAQTPPPRNKGGRPFAIKPEQHWQIIELIASGWTRKQVRKFVKVGMSTLDRFIAQPQVREQIERAREDIRNRAETLAAAAEARRAIEAERERRVEQLKASLLEARAVSQAVAQHQAERATPAAPAARPTPPPETTTLPLDSTALVSGTGSRGAVRVSGVRVNAPSDRRAEIRQSLADIFPEKFGRRSTKMMGYGTRVRPAYKP